MTQKKQIGYSICDTLEIEVGISSFRADPAKCQSIRTRWMKARRFRRAADFGPGIDFAKGNKALEKAIHSLQSRLLPPTKILDNALRSLDTDSGDVSNDEIATIAREARTIESVVNDTVDLQKEYHRRIREFGEDQFKDLAVEYLREDLGYDDIADGVQRTNSLQEAAQYLRSIKLDQLPIWNEFSAAKAQLDAADRSEKARYSKKFAKVKNELRGMKEELREFANVFNPNYDHLARIGSAMKYILGEIGRMAYSEGDKRTLLVNFAYDPKVDFESGKINRDCTEGNPLSFDSWKVHNAKFSWRDDPDKIIGSAYILESENHEGYLEGDEKDRHFQVTEEDPLENIENMFDLEDSSISASEQMARDEETRKEIRESYKLSQKVESIPSDENQDKQENDKALIPVRDYHVLHIEALQCADLSEEMAGQFLDQFIPQLSLGYKLREEGEKIHVSVNWDLAHLSNYAPIQGAMSERLEGSKKIIFQYPQDAMDNFQGGDPGVIYEKALIE